MDNEKTLRALRAAVDTAAAALSAALLAYPCDETLASARDRARTLRLRTRYRACRAELAEAWTGTTHNPQPRTDR